MGLDQYAYVASQAKSWDNSREICYWRKHPNLQGWMEALWLEKLNNQGIRPEESEWGSSFNGVELELTWDDIDRLEQDIQSGHVANLQTVGFFFGNPADDHFRDRDLEFVKNARAELFMGLRVFYNSSW